MCFLSCKILICLKHTSLQEYFNVHLVNTMQNLETLHRDNTLFWRDIMEKCVNFEVVKVAPIVAKCHESMLTAIRKVSSDTDTEVVINK